MPDPNPTLQSLPEARWWRGASLGDLWFTLNEELGRRSTTAAEVQSDGGWYWRALPRGAVVALRRRHDLSGRRELRIARLDAPDTPAGWRAWTAEVAVFLTRFVIKALDGETPCSRPGREWYQVRNEPRDQGKAAVRLQELRRAEVKPGRAICQDCLNETGEIREIEWFPGATAEGQRCSTHAVQAGNRHLEETRRTK